MELLTNAAILSLPGKEVQKRRQRLTDKAEAEPEDHVSGDFAADAFDLLQNIGQGNHGDLDDHAEEGDT